MNQQIKKFMKGMLATIFPPYRKLLDANRLLQDRLDSFQTKYPPGHYYSPVLTAEEVERRKTFIYRNVSLENQIDLNHSKQMELLREFASYLPDFPYSAKSQELMYSLDNGWFENSDGYILFCFLKKFRPKKVIEIGSGHSSALMLDAQKPLFGGNLELTFIDPNPDDRLSQFISRSDNSQNAKVIRREVQEVEVDFFKALDENDILFIDSSHVAKAGSDLNYILFDILPVLRPGVIIHFHDIFYPFEYPEFWLTKLFKGFGWNEVYMLRAFLAHNDRYEVLFFNDYLEKSEESFYKKRLPVCLKRNDANNCGQSLWLRRLAQNPAGLSLSDRKAATDADPATMRL